MACVQRGGYVQIRRCPVPGLVPFAQTFVRDHTAASTLAAELARECPELTSERLHQVGHIFFTSLALQKQDQKSWHMNEQIALKKARLQLETRKHHDKVKPQPQPAADHLALSPTK